MPYTHQDFLRDQKEDLPIVPTHEDLKNGTYIVTGANTGIGFEVAKHLVRLRAKRVILAVRSMERGNAAKAKIEAETGNTGIAEVWILDLGSYASVEAFAKKAQALDRIDAIVENASVALDKQTITEGLETSLTVNVVSTMLLAVLILPKLKESGKKFGFTPGLTIVGSGAMFSIDGVLEKLVPSGDVLDGLTNKPIDRNRYPLTKLLQYYAIRELSELNPVEKTGVFINYVSPGFCVSELNRHVGWISWLAIEVMRLRHARTAEMGSRALLQAMVGGSESHGKYLSNCRIREDYVPDWMNNSDGLNAQKRVWTSISKKLDELQPGCVSI